MNDRPPASAQVSHRSILLVEDHADTAETLRRLLVGEGHDVAVAFTCAEARAMCAGERRFDLILCDLILPDGDGRQLAPLFADRCPEARRVALSAQGLPEDVRTALAAGFEHHVLKPVTLEMLRNHFNHHPPGTHARSA